MESMNIIFLKDFFFPIPVLPSCALNSVVKHTIQRKRHENSAPFGGIFLNMLDGIVQSANLTLF